MELGQHIKGRVIDMKDEHEFRIVITPFCNYRCFFCHSEGFIKESTPLLLSPADYGFVAKAAKELWGWDTLTITGGEPLISPIYRETCEAIAKEGVRITTVTNASLISSPKKILAHNSQINVSLHSMDPDVYRRITCITYPLNQVIDTIISVRSFYPEMAIHLNATVIRGVNDKPEDQQGCALFAYGIGNAVDHLFKRVSADNRYHARQSSENKTGDEGKRRRFKGDLYTKKEVTEIFG